MEFLDLDTGRPASASIPYSNWPMLTRFDASGERLLTTGGGNVAQLWDWRSGTASGPSSATTIKSWPAGQ